MPVREGDKLITMPAIQAVLRSMIVLAAKGNCPAQRALIEIARALEQEHAAEMAADQEVQTNRPMPDLDTARRIAFVLTNAFKGQPEPDKLAANLLVKP